MAEITLKNLAHSYHANPAGSADYALKAIEHTWKQGGAYALLGPSGCGKSTLLNIISGLLEPSEGEVLFDGKVVNRLSVQERNIAQVFQFPVVYDTMTVQDNLAFPLKNVGVPKSQIARKVSEIAQLLELTEILPVKASNLSADEKQKVSMARGLVREDVTAILFDEPLTVIDPNLKWKLRRKLKQIHEQLNITMVYVTHDQLEASTFADEIAVMFDGRIVQFGSPQALFEKPNHTFVGYFIGSPGMNFIPSAGKGSFGVFDHFLSEEQQTALAETASDNVKLGIRPEFVDVFHEASELRVKAHVEMVENLGTYQLLTLNIDGQLIKAKVSDEFDTRSDSVFVELPRPWLKLYVDEYLCGESEHE